MANDSQTSVVLAEPPYPADTRAKGWRFELDLERIEQSDTWALAPAELRPWLLMLWTTAWKQVPCGSLTDDDQLIAVRIGMKPAQFAKARSILMRGWWKAQDGRLYHDTVTARVLDMLGTKDKERQRKAEYRKRKDAEEAGVGQGRDGQGIDPGSDLTVPDLSHGTNAGLNRDRRGSDPGRDGTGTGTRTGTRTGLLRDSVAIATGADVAKPPDELTRDELWTTGKSLLMQSGMPKAQCGSFVGKLVKDYGDGVVVEAVRAAVVARPADPAQYLKASCMRAAGQRSDRAGDAPGAKQRTFDASYYEGAENWQ